MLNFSSDRKGFVFIIPCVVNHSQIKELSKDIQMRLLQLSDNIGLKQNQNRRPFSNQHPSTDTLILVSTVG